MTIFSIYIITNKQNNQSYIGVTCRSIEKRFNEHIGIARRNPNKNYWCNSLNKYGKETFQISLLETTKTQEEAYKRERILIEQYNTLSPNGYNSTAGGRGGSFNPSQELREKLSFAKIGNYNSAGYKHSQEFCDNLSKRMKGKKKTKKSIKKRLKTQKENRMKKYGIFY